MHFILCSQIQIQAHRVQKRTKRSTHLFLKKKSPRSFYLCARHTFIVCTAFLRADAQDRRARKKQHIEINMKWARKIIYVNERKTCTTLTYSKLKRPNKWHRVFRFRIDFDFSHIFIDGMPIPILHHFRSFDKFIVRVCFLLTEVCAALRNSQPGCRSLLFITHNILIQKKNKIKKYTHIAILHLHHIRLDVFPPSFSHTIVYGTHSTDTKHNT